MSARPVRRLLFVCAGNTCRSPLARHLLERLARQAGLAWSAASAGLAAREGSPLSDGAARALAERGLSGLSHRARSVTEEDLARADAAYAMTRAQARELMARFPAQAGKVRVLREEAGLAPADIADPYGGGPGEYAACADAVEEALTALLRRQTTP